MILIKDPNFLKHGQKTLKELTHIIHNICKAREIREECKPLLINPLNKNGDKNRRKSIDEFHFYH